MQVGVSKEPFDQKIHGKEVIPLLQRPMEARDKGAGTDYFVDLAVLSNTPSSWSIECPRWQGRISATVSGDDVQNIGQIRLLPLSKEACFTFRKRVVRFCFQGESKTIRLVVRGKFCEA